MKKQILIFCILILVVVACKQTPKDGFTPFTRAIFDDDVIAMKEIIDSEQIDVNAKLGENGATPLEIAIILNNPEMVRILLENGAEVDLTTKDFTGSNPLVAFVGSANRNARYDLSNTDQDLKNKNVRMEFLKSIIHDKERTLSDRSYYTHLIVSTNEGRTLSLDSEEIANGRAILRYIISVSKI